MTSVSGDAVAEQTRTAYEALRDALRTGRLAAVQAEAVLVILRQLYAAVGLLDRADEALPQYADRPELIALYRLGITEYVVDAFRRELAALAPPPTDTGEPDRTAPRP